MKAIGYFESLALIHKQEKTCEATHVMILELSKIYFMPLTKARFIEVFDGWIISRKDSMLHNAENNSIIFEEKGKVNIRYETNRKKSEGKTFPFIPRNIEQIITDCDNMGIQLYFSEEIKKLLYQK